MRIELGPEPGAGQREQPAAVAGLAFGVLVGEVAAAGAQHHEVPGCRKVGLQVVDRLPGGGVGEGERQVGGGVRAGLSGQGDPDTVDDALPGAGDQRRGSRGAGAGVPEGSTAPGSMR
jgi:hypothetical protein